MTGQDAALRPAPEALRALADGLGGRVVTRFAPAPTGNLHLGHLANAIYTWGAAEATGGRVLVRIEDHDRQRSRPVHEAAILRDLARLGLHEGPPDLRQSDDGRPYVAAAEALRAAGLAYACSCTRADLLAWAGPGCPGQCVRRGGDFDAPGVAWRLVPGAGVEAGDDLLCGRIAGDLGATPDLTLRDRLGNWSYSLSVVVDDLRQGVSLVVRGRDLLDATPAQVRLGRLLGRASPPVFLHHPLIRKPSGAKLSKADGDTGIGLLMDAGVTPEELFGSAAAAVGLIGAAHPLAVRDFGGLLAGGPEWESAGRG